jgi:chemotaxis protein MotB
MATFRKFMRARQATISPIWHVVLSDLMTNLTLFFLVMYSLSRLSNEKRDELLGAISSSVSQTAAIEAKADKLLKNVRKEEVQSKVDSLAKKEGLDRFVKLDISEQMIKITLRSPVLFKTGDAVVSNDTIKILDEVTPLLKSIPNSVIVEGHTDNIPLSGGKYGSNWELSTARAANVISYFVNEKKIPADRFVAAGYGEFRPIAANDTPENRAVNRRIEINIIK